MALHNRTDEEEIAGRIDQLFEGTLGLAPKEAGISVQKKVVASQGDGMALQLVPLPLAFGIVFVLVGLGAPAFGVYALARGGKDDKDGLGGFSERDIQAMAGLRMIAGGVAALFFGILLLWWYFSG